MAIDYQEIGKLIRRYRKARGMTQSELADAIDISHTHMSHIETAGTKLSLPVLLDLADTLEVSPGSLITDRAPNEKEPLLDEAVEILASCSAEDAAMILEVMKTMRSQFRKREV